MALSTTVSLTTTLSIILIAEANMDVQHCTKSEMAPSPQLILSQYAPSLITCSFICKENPECKKFSFSDDVCKLFRLKNDNPTPNAGMTTNVITCTDNKKKVCPPTIDGNKFTCKPDPYDISCVCVSLSRDEIEKEKCNDNNMKLIAVESQAKNMFVLQFIREFQKKCFSCFWTSAFRLKGGTRPLKWNSTGTDVDLSIVNSSSVETLGDFLGYKMSNNAWVWGDMDKNVKCCFLCEFPM